MRIAYRSKKSIGVTLSAAIRLSMNVVSQLRVQACGSRWPDAHDLQNNFLIFRTVEVVNAGGVLHVTAGLQRNRFVGKELVAGTGIPGALQHDDVPVFGMVVVQTHGAGGKLHSDHIETRFGRISADGRSLHTASVGIPHPGHLLRSNTNNGLLSQRKSSKRHSDYDCSSQFASDDFWRGLYTASKFEGRGMNPGGLNSSPIPRILDV